MKIWLDDLRDPPEGWYWVKTAAEAIDAMIDFDDVTDISLDHDLGIVVAETGYDVAKWIEKRVMSDYGYFPPRIWVHTSNPVGRANINGAIQSINRIMAARWQDWITPR